MEAFYFRSNGFNILIYYYYYYYYYTIRMSPVTGISSWYFS